MAAKAIVNLIYLRVIFLEDDREQKKNVQVLNCTHTRVAPGPILLEDLRVFPHQESFWGAN